MNMAIRTAACILLATLAASGASKDIDFVPVRELRPSYLGITAAAPGSEDWFVTEKRHKEGWRIMYKHKEKDVPSRSSIVFLKSDRYRRGKFVREHGSLEQLAGTVLAGTRSPDDAQFKETRAEVVRDDMHGVEAYRIRVVLEERKNPQQPDAVLMLEVAQILMLHPLNADQVISVTVSTQYPHEQEPLSADALASSFVGALRFE